MRAMDDALSLDNEAGSLGSTVAAIRRYWWVVLAIVWLAILGALLATANSPTTYLGRTSLIVSSNDRSPEQDAVLVQGYVDYFDNAAYQKQLLAEAGIDAKTTVTAQAAAASPILVISTTAANAESAQSAAIAVAKAFRDDINEVHSRSTAAALATVQDQLDTALARNGKDDQAVIASLQDRIRQLQADQNNVLQELQSRGGVSVETPSLFNNLVLGSAGGLLLGVLAALALAKFSPRLRSRHDVAAKVGLNTLVELPGPRSKGAALQREQRLRQLANIVRARLAGPGVVAVTQASDGAATGMVCRGLATEWAAQGYRTVLVRFGGGIESASSWPSGSVKDSVRATEAAAVLSRMRPGPVPGLSVLDLRLRLVGGATGLPAGRLTELLALEAFAGAIVILETPAVVGSAAAQSASLVADATLFVIDTRVAKVAETREAIEVLRESRVVPLGAVLAPAGREEEDSPDESEDDGASTGQSEPSSHSRSSATGGTGWAW